MSRITVTIEAALVEEVKQLYEVTSPSEAIERALQEALRSHRRRSALEHRGRIDFDLDQEQLQQTRQTGIELIEHWRREGNIRS